MKHLLSVVSPWTRLCLLGAMVPATFLLYEAPACLLPLLVIGPLGLTSGRAGPWLGRTLALVAPLAFFLGLVYLLAMPLSGEVAWHLGSVSVGRGNVDMVLPVLSRAAVMLSALVLLATTTPAPHLLNDLRRRGAPALVVYILAMTVNLVPLFRHRAACVMEAQTSRGLDFGGGPLTRARRLFPLVGPLLLGALADVEKRAMALELRGGLRRYGAVPTADPGWEVWLRLASGGLVSAAMGYRVWMLFQ